MGRTGGDDDELHVVHVAVVVGVRLGHDLLHLVRAQTQPQAPHEHAQLHVRQQSVAVLHQSMSSEVK